MRKKLLDKIIKGCGLCPMFNHVNRECTYTHIKLADEPFALNDEVMPNCPLPDAPVTKILRITKCIDCIYCKMSDVGTCIVTYPPNHKSNYDCWKGAFHMRSEDCVNAGIHENCPLEDEEE